MIPDEFIINDELLSDKILDKKLSEITVREFILLLQNDFRFKSSRNKYQDVPVKILEILKDSGGMRFSDLRKNLNITKDILKYYIKKLLLDNRVYRVDEFGVSLYKVREWKEIQT